MGGSANSAGAGIVNWPGAIGATQTKTPPSPELVVADVENPRISAKPFGSPPLHVIVSGSVRLTVPVKLPGLVRVMAAWFVHVSGCGTVRFVLNALNIDTACPADRVRPGGQR